MESQPQNPELRNNPENFHPCHLGVTSNERVTANADAVIAASALLILPTKLK